MFTQMAGKLPAAELERINASFANTPQYVVVSAMESMGDEALYATDKINVPVLCDSWEVAVLAGRYRTVCSWPRA
jgi:hypothetical protein